MPHISKEQIDVVCKHLSYAIDEVGEANELHKMLQSLLDQPEGEPVGWMNHDGDLFTVSQHKKFGSGSTPLYTHAQPLQLITAEDVTDEMTKEMQTALFTEGVNDKDIMVFAVNVYFKHRGDTK